MFAYDTEKKTIHIHDEIGPSWWGLIDGGVVNQALSEMGGSDVTVHLNTPGGSVDEGIAIFNSLIRYPGKVTTVVDSLAASMGSYLLQAGETRVVSSNSMVMIHDPWTIAMGNSAELRKGADTLDKYAIRMIPDYSRRSGKSDDEILQIMADETWLAGQEIIDEGFADVMESNAKATAYRPMVAGLHRYCSKIPESLQKLRIDNERGRMDDKLLSVGIDRKCMSTAEAKRLAEQSRTASV